MQQQGLDGIDEDTAIDAQELYLDEDGDGYGTPENAQRPTVRF